MIPNAKLKKKILSEDGQVLRHSEDWFPLCITLNTSARKESINIAKGLDSGSFSLVVETKSTLLDNNADRIEIEDAIELLFNSIGKRIVAYIEKKYEGNNIYYLIGLK